jgi:hypothetical protein
MVEFRVIIMQRIIHIGFEYVGRWSITNDTIDFVLEKFVHENNVLYAFILNN